MKRADLAKEWQQRLGALERSGLRVSEFCRREGVSTATFYKWRRRVEAEQPSSFALDFVEVEAQEQGNARPRHRILELAPLHWKTTVELDEVRQRLAADPGGYPGRRVGPSRCGFYRQTACRYVLRRTDTLVLTGQDTDDTMVQAHLHGAEYLRKPVGAASVTALIRRARRQSSQPLHTSPLLRAVGQFGEIHRLSQRETELLAAIACRARPGQLSEQARISVNSVKTITRRLLRRTDHRNVDETLRELLRTVGECARWARHSPDGLRRPGDPDPPAVGRSEVDPGTQLRHEQHEGRDLLGAR